MTADLFGNINNYDEIQVVQAADLVRTIKKREFPFPYQLIKDQLISGQNLFLVHEYLGYFFNHLVCPIDDFALQLIDMCWIKGATAKNCLGEVMEILSKNAESLNYTVDVRKDLKFIKDVIYKIYDGSG